MNFSETGWGDAQKMRFIQTLEFMFVLSIVDIVVGIVIGRRLLLVPTQMGLYVVQDIVLITNTIGMADSNIV